MRKIIAITFLVIALITAMILIFWNPNGQQDNLSTQIESEVQESGTTGLIVEPTPTGTLIPSVETVIRPYLPVKLTTAIVSFNYKKNDIQIDYCGDFALAMDEFRAFLDEKHIDRTFLKEDEIIVNNDGECIQ